MKKRNRKGVADKVAGGSPSHPDAKPRSVSKMPNALSQPQNRWQRAVRYNWDKNRGRG